MRFLEQEVTDGQVLSRAHAHTRITVQGKENGEIKRGSAEGERKRAENHGGYRRQVPLLLNTEEFRQAWEDWVEYRIEAGRKHNWPLTNRCFDKSLQKCIEWGIDRSIAAIDFSIEMGYRGLFEPRKFENPTNGSRQRRETCL